MDLTGLLTGTATTASASSQARDGDPSGSEFQGLIRKLLDKSGEEDSVQGWAGQLVGRKSSAKGQNSVESMTDANHLLKSTGMQQGLAEMSAAYMSIPTSALLQNTVAQPSGSADAPSQDGAAVSGEGMPVGPISSRTPESVQSAVCLRTDSPRVLSQGQPGSQIGARSSWRAMVSQLATSTTGASASDTGRTLGLAEVRVVPADIQPDGQLTLSLTDAAVVDNGLGVKSASSAQPGETRSQSSTPAPQTMGQGTPAAALDHDAVSSPVHSTPGFTTAPVQSVTARVDANNASGISVTLAVPIAQPERDTISPSEAQALLAPATQPSAGATAGAKDAGPMSHESARDVASQAVLDQPIEVTPSSTMEHTTVVPTASREPASKAGTDQGVQHESASPVRELTIESPGAAIPMSVESATSPAVPSAAISQSAETGVMTTGDDIGQPEPHLTFTADAVRQVVAQLNAGVDTTGPVVQSISASHTSETASSAAEIPSSQSAKETPPSSRITATVYAEASMPAVLSAATSFRGAQAYGRVTMAPMVGAEPSETVAASGTSASKSDARVAVAAVPVTEPETGVTGTDGIPFAGAQTGIRTEVESIGQTADTVAGNPSLVPGTATSGMAPSRTGDLDTARQVAASQTSGSPLPRSTTETQSSSRVASIADTAGSSPIASDAVASLRGSLAYGKATVAPMLGTEPSETVASKPDGGGQVVEAPVTKSEVALPVSNGARLSDAQPGTRTEVETSGQVTSPSMGSRNPIPDKGIGDAVPNTAGDADTVRRMADSVEAGAETRSPVIQAVPTLSESEATSRTGGSPLPQSVAETTSSSRVMATAEPSVTPSVSGTTASKPDAGVASTGTMATEPEAAVVMTNGTSIPDAQTGIRTDSNSGQDINQAKGEPNPVLDRRISDAAQSGADVTEIPLTAPEAPGSVKTETAAPADPRSSAHESPMGAEAPRTRTLTPATADTAPPRAESAGAAAVNTAAPSPATAADSSDAVVAPNPGLPMAQQGPSVTGPASQGSPGIPAPMAQGRVGTGETNVSYAVRTVVQESSRGAEMSHDDASPTEQAPSNDSSASETANRPSASKSEPMVGTGGAPMIIADADSVVSSQGDVGATGVGSPEVMPQPAPANEGPTVAPTAEPATPVGRSAVVDQAAHVDLRSVARSVTDARVSSGAPVAHSERQATGSTSAAGTIPQEPPTVGERSDAIPSGVGDGLAPQPGRVTDASFAVGVGSDPTAEPIVAPAAPAVERANERTGPVTQVSVPASQSQQSFEGGISATRDDMPRIDAQSDRSSTAQTAGYGDRAQDARIGVNSDSVDVRADVVAPVAIDDGAPASANTSGMSPRVGDQTQSSVPIHAASDAKPTKEPLAVIRPAVGPQQPTTASRGSGTEVASVAPKSAAGEITMVDAQKTSRAETSADTPGPGVDPSGPRTVTAASREAADTRIPAPASRGSAVAPARVDQQVTDPGSTTLEPAMTPAPTPNGLEAAHVEPAVAHGATTLEKPEARAVPPVAGTIANANSDSPTNGPSASVSAPTSREAVVTADCPTIVTATASAEEQNAVPAQPTGSGPNSAGDIHGPQGDVTIAPRAARDVVPSVAPAAHPNTQGVETHVGSAVEQSSDTTAPTPPFQTRQSDPSVTHAFTSESAPGSAPLAPEVPDTTSPAQPAATASEANPERIQSTPAMPDQTLIASDQRAETKQVGGDPTASPRDPLQPTQSLPQDAVVQQTRGGGEDVSLADDASGSVRKPDAEVSPQTQPAANTLVSRAETPARAAASEPSHGEGADRSTVLGSQAPMETTQASDVRVGARDEQIKPAEQLASGIDQGGVAADVQATAQTSRSSSPVVGAKEPAAPSTSADSGKAGATAIHPDAPVSQIAMPDIAVKENRLDRPAEQASSVRTVERVVSEISIGAGMRMAASITDMASATAPSVALGVRQTGAPRTATIGDTKTRAVGIARTARATIGAGVTSVEPTVGRPIAVWDAISTNLTGTSIDSRYADPIAEATQSQPVAVNRVVSTATDAVTAQSATVSTGKPDAAHDVATGHTASWSRFWDDILTNGDVRPSLGETAQAVEPSTGAGASNAVPDVAEFSTRGEASLKSERRQGGPASVGSVPGAEIAHVNAESISGRQDRMAVDSSADPVRPAVDPTMATNVIHQIVKAAKVSIVDGGGTMTMQLQPAHLGSVRMNVTVQQGVVTAAIEAGTDTAKRVLESDLAGLKRSLADAGMVVDSVKVSVSSDGAHGFGTQSNLNHGRQEQTFQRGPQHGHPTRDQEIPQAAAQSAAPTTLAGQLNYLA